jgi:hypothetical protein
MDELALLVKELRKNRPEPLQPKDLAAATGITLPMLRKYLAGGRFIPPNRAEALRLALAQTPEEKSRFDSLYEKHTARFKNTADHPSSTGIEKLLLLSLPYYPFCGAPDKSKCFMEFNLDKMLGLSGTAVDPLEDQNAPGQPPRFNMQERMAAIENGRADLLFNLITLPRMKRIFYLATPIRISLNAVVFLNEAHREKGLQEASELLVHGNQPENPGDHFRIIVVRDEIGHSYLSQSVHVPESMMEMKDTLDPEELAESMRNLSSGRVMLVCDEHTCLGVLRQLKGSGVLVLPPNTDQAVIHSSERRIPPAYYFGIGMKRDRTELTTYMSETMSAYLSLETETIAESMEGLYRKLVDYVKECLAETGIYVGGLRRTFYRVSDAPLDLKKVDPPSDKASDQQPDKNALAAQWKHERSMFVDQHARAVARKTLSLSRRSIESLPREMDSWRVALTRARQRIQIYDGGDRGRLRSIILCCAKLALGKDPFMPEPDPIGLLRNLVPVTREQREKDRQDGLLSPFAPLSAQALSPEEAEDAGGHWEDFLRLLERELDMDLTELRDFPERKFYRSRDLGKLISTIQRLLEASAESSIVLAIRRYKPADQHDFAQLRKEYARKKPNRGNQLPENPSPEESKTLKRFIAYNLSEPVGFIEGEEKFEFFQPDESRGPDAKVDLSNTILINHLYVADHIHHSGVSRLLIRKMIEEGNDTAKSGVWIEAWKWSEKEKEPEKFVRSGFVERNPNLLWYELKLAEQEKKVIPDPASRRGSGSDEGAGI